MYESTYAGAAWAAFAERVGQPDDALCDRLFGQTILLVTDQTREELTTDSGAALVAVDVAPKNRRTNRQVASATKPVATRQADPQGDIEVGCAPDLILGRAEAWVVMSRTDCDASRELIASLDARVAEWIDTTARYVSADGGVHLAYQDGWLHLTGRAGAPFLSALLKNSQPIPSLADDPSFKAARRMGDGAVFYFGRDAGGDIDWVAGVASMSPNGIRVRSLAHHSEPASKRELFAHRLDHGAFHELTPGSVLTGIEVVRPETVRQSPVMQVLIAPVADRFPQLVDRLGPTGLTVVNAVEASSDGAHDTLTFPALTWGTELRQPDEAVEELDQIMLGTLKAMQTFGGDRFKLQVPDRLPSDPQQQRRVDITPYAGRMADLPNGVQFEMAWSTVRRQPPLQELTDDSESQPRHWWIVGTNAREQKRVAQTVAHSPRCTARLGLMSHTRLSGSAAAAMLDTWPMSGADGDTPTLLGQFHAMRELMRPLDRVEWWVRRTSPVTVESRVEITWR